MYDSQEPATTIRPDTSKRHQRKYSNRNPLHQYVLRRFLKRMVAEINRIRPSHTLDVGCGEGLFLARVQDLGALLGTVDAIDIRDDAISVARASHPLVRFHCENILTWQPPAHYNLVIASEILEHMPDPHALMKRLCVLTSSKMLLSVPLEPWFRLMNLARGRDILHLGNHPEHVNHWDIPRFSRFIEAYARVDRIYASFPFIIAVASVRQSGAPRCNR